MTTCSKTDKYIDKDYVTLRNENLNKITDYYNKYLDKYSEKYIIHQTRLMSDDPEDRNEAQDTNSSLTMALSVYNEYILKNILLPLVRKIEQDTQFHKESETTLEENQNKLEKLREQKRLGLKKMKEYKAKNNKNHKFFDENKESNDYFIYKHAMIMIGLIIIIMLTIYFMVSAIHKQSFNNNTTKINPILL